MPSIILDFVPPEFPGFSELQVWESATKLGAPGTLAQTFVIDPAAYPTRITVTTAASLTNWFSIRWRTAAGATTDYSDPIQGGTATLIGILVNRVLLRQPTSNENVVLQTTEAVVEEFFGVDPYTIDPATVNFRTLEGLTLYIMARDLIWEIASSYASSSGSGWAAGLVSMKASSQEQVETSRANIEWLLKEAQKLLGLGYSRIAQLKIEIAGGMSQIVTADISRLLIEVE